MAPVTSLKAQDFGLALLTLEAALFESNDRLLALRGQMIGDPTHPDLAWLASLVALAKPAPDLVVDPVPHWHAFDACEAPGLAGLLGKLRSLPLLPEMGSQSILILQLMKRVQAHADIHELEKNCFSATPCCPASRCATSTAQALGFRSKSNRNAMPCHAMPCHDHAGLPAAVLLAFKQQGSRVAAKATT